MKKMMMLGAGSCQLNAIKKIKELGFSVVVSDNRLESPGKKIGDVSVLADTFSYDLTLKAAMEVGIDGVMTSGTDQPVLTVNKVAESLDLPQLISVETALGVTNKKYMKTLFSQHKIPTSPYVICSRDFDPSIFVELTPPYVIKPLDSQGQRGIYKVASIDDVRSHFDRVLAFSREEEILVESYYKNDEITVTGWVQNGQVHVLTVTDRVSFSSDLHIGVCTAHEYPSRQLASYRACIMSLTEKICKIFNISHGPIYFQYLVGADGVYVNEIACRIGGAYEDVFVPLVTGIDLLELTILNSIEPDGNRLKSLESILADYTYSELGKRVSVQLFFCGRGIVETMTPKNDLISKSYVLDMGYNIAIGDQLQSIENASQRAGYAIIIGEDEVSLHQNIDLFYDEMKVLDREGNNLVMKQKRIYRD